MEMVLCPNCSYPIAARLGQSVKCPYCGVSGTVVNQTEVQMRGKTSSQVQTQVQTKIGGPGPLDFFLGLLLGMVFGPAMKEGIEKGLKRIP